MTTLVIGILIGIAGFIAWKKYQADPVGFTTSVQQKAQGIVHNKGKVAKIILLIGAVEYIFLALALVFGWATMGHLNQAWAAKDAAIGANNRNDPFGLGGIDSSFRAFGHLVDGAVSGVWCSMFLGSAAYLKASKGSMRWRAYMRVVRQTESSGPPERAAMPAAGRERWFLHVSGQTSGPFCKAELDEKAKDVEQGQEALIAREGESEWLPIASILRQNQESILFDHSSPGGKI